MNIVYPTDQEMQQAIEVICVKALKKTVNLAVNFVCKKIDN